MPSSQLGIKKSVWNLEHTIGERKVKKSDIVLTIVLFKTQYPKTTRIYYFSYFWVFIKNDTDLFLVFCDLLFFLTLCIYRIHPCRSKLHFIFCWWTFQLYPAKGYYKQDYKNPYACIFLYELFLIWGLSNISSWLDSSLQP